MHSASVAFLRVRRINIEIKIKKIKNKRLNLLQTAKHGRRYSTQTTVLAFILRTTSNAMHRNLRKVLILPSATRLCQLSSAISIEDGDIQFDYLDQRT